MELDKRTHVLHIATDDYQLVKNTVDKVNRVYKTNFVYLESVDIDGVMFSYVDAFGISIDHIFLLGSFFGSASQKRRSESQKMV